jgi:hypothetical protein
LQVPHHGFFSISLTTSWAALPRCFKGNSTANPG